MNKNVNGDAVTCIIRYPMHIEIIVYISCNSDFKFT